MDTAAQHSVDIDHGNWRCTTCNVGGWSVNPERLLHQIAQHVATHPKEKP